MKRTSLTGYTIYLKTHENGFTPLCAVSRKQATVSLSSMESETSALAAGCVEGMATLNITSTLFPQNVRRNIIVGCDSSSALMLCRRSGAGRKSRHLEMRLFFLQDIFRRPEWNLIKISTNENTSDVLTKIISSPPEWCFAKLGFIRP